MLISALLTRMSIGPHWLRAQRDQFVDLDAVDYVGYEVTDRRIGLDGCSRFFERLNTPDMTTCAPAVARAMAMARPMPLPPPVTSATLL